MVVGVAPVGGGAGAGVALDPLFADRAALAEGALSSAGTGTGTGDVASDVTTIVDGAATSVVTDAPTSAITDAAALDETSVDADAAAVVAVVGSARWTSTPTTRAAGASPQLANASTNEVDSTIIRRVARVRIDAET